MKTVSTNIEEKIINDYKTGKYSLRELGIKYSYSKSTILRIMQKNHIPMINKRLVNEQLIENYFENIDCEEKAYFLGFIFADGSVSDKGQLTIDINEKDIDILLAFKQVIKSNCKINTRTKGNSVMSRIAIKNNNFVQHLHKYGIVPNKTKNTKHLPLNLIPKNLWRHFLRGLIDGDGWISRPIESCKTWYKIGFVTQYATTAQDFVNMINEIIEDKWTNKIINRNNNQYAVVQVQKKTQVKQLATALYADNNICLSRKLLIAQEIIDSKIC